MGDNPNYQRKRRLRGQTPDGGPGTPKPQSRGPLDPDPPRRSTREQGRGPQRIIKPRER